MITFDDFKRVEITVGKILSAEKVPETDKLLKLSVDFGISPLEKGVPNSDSGRVVTPLLSKTTVLPLLGEITPALQGSGTPFIKGDTATPQVPSSTEEGRQDTPLNPPSEERGEKTSPERDIRQIISGISAYFPDPQTLVGRKCMFVTNLEPRVIKGLESNGMLFAVSTADGKFSLLEPNAEIQEGTKAR